MRELTAGESAILMNCLRELAEYHNAISLNFKGSHPSKPFEVTLSAFDKALKEGTSSIAVIEQEGLVIGFCKVDYSGENGLLDYLFVNERYRGKGYGGELMDWAMDTFARHDVYTIEVKVVYGNPTRHLYEKYGFKVKTLLMVAKSSRNS